MRQIRTRTQQCGTRTCTRSLQIAYGQTAVLVLRAAETNHRQLENEPAEKG